MRAGLVLVGLAFSGLVLSGCTIVQETFTKPTGRICVDRQQFIDEHAIVKVLYKRLRAHAQERCERGEFDCADLRQVDARAKEVNIRIEAKIEVPESELDKDAIKELLSALISLVP